MASEPSPAFLFYVKDWRSSHHVQQMTYDERGRYLELLNEQWETGSIPATPQAIAALFGDAEAGWARAWKKLSPCFSKRSRDGRLVNLKLDALRRERERYRKAQADSGLRGAKARWRAHRVAIGSNGDPIRSRMANDGLPSATATKGSLVSTSPSATATGSPRLAPSSSSSPRSQNGNKGSAKAFIVEFQRLYSQYRSGASYHEHRHDRALVDELLTRYASEHLIEMARVLLTLDAASDKWVAEGDRSLSVLNHRAVLLDERVRKRGPPARIASGRNCSHDPRCESYQQCTERTLSENREEKGALN